jgi:predicted membrane-bound dolichyl-phosphate-mannose-protein mannosyltransferase
MVRCFGQVVSGWSPFSTGLAADVRREGWLIFEKVVVYMDSSITSRHVVVGLMVCRYYFLLLLLRLIRAGASTAGEICTDWQSWGQYLNIQYILGQSLLHSFVYVALAVSSITLTTLLL